MIIELKVKGLYVRQRVEELGGNILNVIEIDSERKFFILIVECQYHLKDVIINEGFKTFLGKLGKTILNNNNKKN